ncbi:hypothetical protein Sjap_012364 [Stephania japonica]|uniref:Uncharacterized protein n=1 Tax=Stephania japonica TaxID=461633 RepID=A0AAP0IXT4_9MAGN
MREGYRNDSQATQKWGEGGGCGADGGNGTQCRGMGERERTTEIEHEKKGGSLGKVVGGNKGAIRGEKKENGSRRDHRRLPRLPEQFASTPTAPWNLRG